jgi:CheY-like chemotaxis protein
MEALSPKRPAVLVVEDEPLVLMCALEALGDEGFDAIAATNADEAMYILENRDDIDIVFTDINMPGSMDGLRLARAVRGRWPPIRIIVASAVRTAGMEDLPEGGLFFQKPYRCGDLADAIRELTASAPTVAMGAGVPSTPPPHKAAARDAL